MKIFLKLIINVLPLYYSSAAAWQKDVTHINPIQNHISKLFVFKCLSYQWTVIAAYLYFMHVECNHACYKKRVCLICSVWCLWLGGYFNSFFLDYVSSHLINDAPGKYKHFRKKIWSYLENMTPPYDFKISSMNTFFYLKKYHNYVNI